LSVEVLHGKGYFFLANKNSFDWANCDLDLNDDFTFKIAFIKAYDILQIPAGDFTKRNGDRFNPALTKALRMFIYCRQTPYGSLSTTVSWR